MTAKAAERQERIDFIGSNDETVLLVQFCDENYFTSISRIKNEKCTYVWARLLAGLWRTHLCHVVNR